MDTLDHANKGEEVLAIKDRTSLLMAKPLPQEGFIRLPQVLNVLGMSKTSFMDGVRDGRFPAQVKLGPRMSAWRVEDIRDLIARLSEGTK